MSETETQPDPVAAERERISRILAATTGRTDLVKMAQAAIQKGAPADAAVAVMLSVPNPKPPEPIGRVLYADAPRRPQCINPGRA